MMWGCLSVAELGPLVLVKGTLNGSPYKEILNNFMLPILWEQLEDGFFLFQHDCDLCAKSGEGESLVWVNLIGQQGPDLNPIEDLWDNLGQRLRAKPPSTSVAPLEEQSKTP